MNKENQKIISILTEYLMDNSDIRFGQALFNLGINEFADKKEPSNKFHLYRDIYNDESKDILARVNEATKAW